MAEEVNSTSGPNVRTVARSRGALTGILLIVLGLWGGLIAFIGGYFDFGYNSTETWHWTAIRGWYEVLPGAATLVGGVLLLIGTSRLIMVLGSLLAIAAGGWFIIGPPLSRALLTGTVGGPAGSNNDSLLALRSLAYFYLLGAIIVFLGTAAFARLTVVSVRDMERAERRHNERLAAEQAEREERERSERSEREAEQRGQWDTDNRTREEAERAEVERAARDRDAANRAAAQQWATRSDEPTDPGRDEPSSRRASTT